MDDGWVSACCPADFEEHAALLLSATELLSCSPRTVVDVVGTLIDRIPLLLAVSCEEQRRQAIVLLIDWGLPAHRVQFVFMPVGTWARDFGPAFVRRSDGRVCVVDADYPFPDRPNCDVVPAALASLLKLPRRRVPLVLEGGNLLSNGWDLCAFTSALLDVNRFAGRQYDFTRVAALLEEYYGFSQAVMLEPLLRYRTLHVDMFATFVRPDVALVGAADPRADGDVAALLDRNAAALARATTRGLRVHVLRVPMPPYDGRCCRSYTNVIYANGTLLLPHYPGVDPRLEREVRSVYAALLPGWKIIEIDCGDLIRFGGALRCMSAPVPWLTEQFEVCEETTGGPTAAVP